jgi:ferredoxin
MRISVDRAECVGHGRCYTVSPDVFAPDDEGFCADRGEERPVPAGLEAAAEAGAQACPAAAITVNTGPAVARAGAAGAPGTGTGTTD